MKEEVLTKALRFTRQNLNAIVGLALVVALMATYLAKEPVSAHHEPANKFAAAGAGLDDMSPDEAHVVLRETMKVSTPFDLALSATAECSILTYLRSATSGQEDKITGTVDMWVTLDGNRVPVQTTGYTGSEVGEEPGSDNGEVTFCNRTYARRITDTESAPDGIDEERDYIDTKTANAFNWFALDVGSNYDVATYGYDDDNDPNTPDVVETGNNIIVVELWAEYDDTDPATGACQATTDVVAAPTEDDPDATAPQEDCSKAYVGKRVLVAEPTNASVHEQVNPGPGAGD
jgi:hypothetical protein